MRTTTSFVCQECGYESPQWLGKCPECGLWNSLKEISNIKYHPSADGSKSDDRKSYDIATPKKLEEIESKQEQRMSTGFSEMDGVLGGGIVPGSVILLAGDPGVGKSTLLLQVGLALAGSIRNGTEVAHKNFLVRNAKKGSSSNRFKSPANAHGENFVSSPCRILYISGEESAGQVKLRASRIYKNYKDIKNISILSSTNTDLVLATIEKIKPTLAIIDSIQTMESENVGGLSGSIGQVRYAASMLIKIAKTLNIPIFIVGHVTKEGMIAGPMVLSHMVDTLLFLEGEKFTNTRILRSLKNRFGPVDEIGVFTMGEEGIKETNSLEQLFLTKNLPKNLTGSIISVALEGSKAFLVEIQGLVVSSKIPIPRRVSTGVDYKRLELLLAVLQKHCNLPFGAMDVFVNVAGGLRLSDPAADLGICLAIFSSFKNISLGSTIAISEVGLLGELRPVQFLDKRISQAKKLGFTNIISHNTYKTLNEVIRSLSK